MASDDQAAWFGEAFATMQANVESVIKGKASTIKLVLVSLFAEGHILLEDVPGTGKTSLAKAVAGSMHGSWNRIQFTPDLLPSDVTGVMIFNQKTSAFEFHPGAVFANIVLGDEINRASPKTQSALLEVMEEQQVTVDSKPYPVPRPFVVIATQNPIEHDGTYRLPEAQLDRFLMRISLGYLDHGSEMEVLTVDGVSAALDRLRPVLSPSQAEGMITVARQVHVPEVIQDYIVRICRATRHLPEVRLGVSTRGALALMRCARAYAASEGRSYINVDDVKTVMFPVLNHRFLLTPESELKAVTPEQLLQRVVAQAEAPKAERVEG